MPDLNLIVVRDPDEAEAAEIYVDGRIGGRAFSPHKVAAVDLSQVNAGIEVPMDMILGYSTLRQANWLLDFPRRRWALSK